jgi:hypothetical protein
VVLLSRQEAPATGAGAPVISAWSATSLWGPAAGGRLALVTAAEAGGVVAAAALRLPEGGRS